MKTHDGMMLEKGHNYNVCVWVYAGPYRSHRDRGPQHDALLLTPGLRVSAKVSAADNSDARREGCIDSPAAHHAESERRREILKYSDDDVFSW